MGGGVGGTSGKNSKAMSVDTTGTENLFLLKFIEIRVFPLNIRSINIIKTGKRFKHFNQNEHF